eukprot:TRINITY_DN12257_c3_g1_i1.p1 TRINITY_DN12257_c3_g1~~TRINITY_DN12257_c3_g1_i1.p1  ORF type:complete len:1030 (+),score=192.72 TRINITY_DN12257_c3_g1_i1:313-3402(+)
MDLGSMLQATQSDALVTAAPQVATSREVIHSYIRRHSCSLLGSVAIGSVQDISQLKEGINKCLNAHRLSTVGELTISANGIKYTSQGCVPWIVGLHRVVSTTRSASERVIAIVVSNKDNLREAFSLYCFAASSDAASDDIIASLNQAFEYGRQQRAAQLSAGQDQNSLSTVRFEEKHSRYSPLTVRRTRYQTPEAAIVAIEAGFHQHGWTSPSNEQVAVLLKQSAVSETAGGRTSPPQLHTAKRSTKSKARGRASTAVPSNKGPVGIRISTASTTKTTRRATIVSDVESQNSNRKARRGVSKSSDSSPVLTRPSRAQSQQAQPSSLLDPIIHTAPPNASFDPEQLLDSTPASAMSDPPLAPKRARKPNPHLKIAMQKAMQQASRKMGSARAPSLATIPDSHRDQSARTSLRNTSPATARRAAAYVEPSLDLDDDDDDDVMDVMQSISASPKRTNTSTTAMRTSPSAPTSPSRSSTGQPVAPPRAKQPNPKLTQALQQAMSVARSRTSSMQSRDGRVAPPGSHSREHAVQAPKQPSSPKPAGGMGSRVVAQDTRVSPPRMQAPSMHATTRHVASGKAAMSAASSARSAVRQQQQQQQQQQQARQVRTSVQEQQHSKAPSQQQLQRFKQHSAERVPSSSTRTDAQVPYMQQPAAASKAPGNETLAKADGDEQSTAPLIAAAFQSLQSPSNPPSTMTPVTASHPPEQPVQAPMVTSNAIPDECQLDSRIQHGSSSASTSKQPAVSPSPPPVTVDNQDDEAPDLDAQTAQIDVSATPLEAHTSVSLNQSAVSETGPAEEDSNVSTSPVALPNESVVKVTVTSVSSELETETQPSPIPSAAAPVTSPPATTDSALIATRVSSTTGAPTTSNATVTLLTATNYSQAAQDIVRARALSDGATRHNEARARAPTLSLVSSSKIALKDLRPGLVGFDVCVKVIRPVVLVKVDQQVTSSTWHCGQNQHRVDVQFRPPFAEPPKGACLLLLNCSASMHAQRLTVTTSQFKLLEPQAVVLDSKDVFNLAGVNVWSFPTVER